jgi:hypothetical protein
VNEGRLEEPHAVEGECDPVPAADARAPDGDAHAYAQAWGLSLPDRPIQLADIDQLLETSVDVELLGRRAPIRNWRDALTSVLELLTYARAILAADVAILRHSPAFEGPDGQPTIDELPEVMSSRSWGDGWSEPAYGPDDSNMDENFFIRSDQLTSAHLEMARTDLSAPADVARALVTIQGQLTALTERQEAVEARLRQIRTAIVREYQQEAAPARDRPA